MRRFHEDFSKRIFSLTECVSTADPYAGVGTLLTVTGLVERTLTVSDAFRPAVRWVINVAGFARTQARTIDNSLLAVWPAGVACAGVSWLCFCEIKRRLYSTGARAIGQPTYQWGRSCDRI
jgi:hypothetical protein